MKDNMSIATKRDRNYHSLCTVYESEGLSFAQTTQLKDVYKGCLQGTNVMYKLL